MFLFRDAKGASQNQQLTAKKPSDLRILRPALLEFYPVLCKFEDGLERAKPTNHTTALAAEELVARVFQRLLSSNTHESIPSLIPRLKMDRKERIPHTYNCFLPQKKTSGRHFSKAEYPSFYALFINTNSKMHRNRQNPQS
jgi:hypothetical protein